jgi:hypothetical protein
MYEFNTAFDVLFLLNEKFGCAVLKYKGDKVQIIIHGSEVLAEGPTFEDTATLVANKILRGDIKV